MSSLAEAVALTLGVFGPGARVLRPEPKLRPFQDKLVEDVRQAIQAGHTKILVQSSTGSGKTPIAAFMVRGTWQRGGTALLAVHRRELVENAIDTFVEWGIPREEIGVIRADDSRTNAAARIQVASVQTLSRRTQLPEFDLAIVDEGHRASALSYACILAKITIAITASPLRTDGKGLGSAGFTILLAGPQPAALVRDGYLSDPIVYAAPLTVKIGYSELQNNEALGEIMSAPKIVGNVVGEYIRLAEGRRGFTFAASVSHSRTLTERYLKEGVRAVHVDGTTPDAEREAAFRDLSSGAIDMLVSYAVAIEGVNVVAAKYAALARPTSSTVVLLQSCGRILRPWRGITPIVSDHGGNFARLGHIMDDREWSLEGELDGSRSKPPSKYSCCAHCFAMVLSTRPCPLCGQTAPSREEQQIKADETVALEKLAAIEATPVAERRRFYEAMRAKGQARSWKPIAAALAFKSKYKQMPPKEWG